MNSLWSTLSKQEQDSRTNYQVMVEESMLSLSEQRYWEEYNIAPDEGKPEQSLLNSCVKQLTPLFQEWIDKTSISDRTPNWVHPMFSLGASKMADITMRCMILEWFTSKSWDSKDSDLFTALPTAQTIAHSISSLAIEIIAYQHSKDNNRNDWMKQSHYQKNWSPKRCRAFTKKMGNLSPKNFSRKNREDFGHHMIRIIEKSNVIYSKNIRVNTGKKWMERVVLCFSSDVLNELNKRHVDMVSVASLLYRPMIVPPVPHSLKESGGNILKFVRKPMVQKFKDVSWDEVVVQKGSTPSDMVVDGLNAMMHTEWSINTRVLDVMNNLFRNNTKCCNLPAYSFMEFGFSDPYPTDGTKEDKAKWCTIKQDLYSTWFKEERARGRMLVRLKLANDLVKAKFFYQIYTCDFRGRANSACDLLSSQSSDFDRGLIQFSIGLPQTTEGLYWLKVHLANLFDQDKLLFDDRVKWVDDNMKSFELINEDPYNHKGLWVCNKKKKNTSFQRLAAIFDLLRSDGLTQIPVQMDGSCNGVQHWVALMKAKELSKHVNLENVEKPGDLYQHVADLVTVSMDLVKEQDTKSGKWAKEFLTHWNGYINRSICKRAVMTDPYGVTLFGIRRYCKSEGHLDWVDKEKMAGAVMELSSFIDKSLKGTLIQPNKGKVWLKFIADEISKNNKTLEWITPCGFHVVHQYFPFETRRSITKLFNMKELYFGTFNPDLVDTRAVNLAIAPNYIHSLDASHMWSTILRMITANITSLSMVHDSYGCHAPNVALMRKFTLEEFHTMHSIDLLESLRNQLQNQFNIELPNPPEKGDLDIDNVLSAQYLFQ